MAESNDASGAAVAFGRGPGSGEPLNTEERVLAAVLVAVGIISGATSIGSADFALPGMAGVYVALISSLALLGERWRGEARTLRVLAVIEALVWWIVAIHVGLLISAEPTEILWYAMMLTAVSIAVLRTFPIGDRWLVLLFIASVAAWLGVLAWLLARFVAELL